MGTEVMHTNGFTGEGVTVAVIDSSFRPNSQEIVDNVASTKLFDSGDNCHGSIKCGRDDESHGTAVAEIIVDMAPDVSLRLYTIDNSVDFDNAVDDAILNDVDIIHTSLAFNVGPDSGVYFRGGESHIAKKLTLAEAVGIPSVVSVGNMGDRHVSKTYVPSTFVSPSDIGLYGYQSVVEFDPEAEGVHKACLPVSYHGSETFTLTWEDEWDGAKHDYDLFLFDSYMGDAVLSSDWRQRSSWLFDEPEENIVVFAFPWESSKERCLVVASYFTSQDQKIRIQVSNGVEIRSDIPDLTRFGSLNTPADSPGTIAVGAIGASTNLLQSYSGAGPTDDGRPKPEICGLANVFSHEWSPWSFGGTSAAAAHVTGLIATLLEAQPDLKGTGKDAILKILEEYAANDTSYSHDNLCGANSGLASLASYTGNALPTSPATTMITSPQDGSVQSHNIVTISGTATPGARVDIFDYTTSITHVSVYADTNGNWIFDTLPLKAGKHMFSAVEYEKDAPSATSKPITITVLTDGSSTIVYPADGSTMANNDVTIAGTAIPGALVVLYSNTTMVATTSSDALSGAWTINASLETSRHALTAVVHHYGMQPITSDPVNIITRPS